MILRRLLIAMLFAVCSMPVWAAGNFQCTVKVTPTGFTNSDIGSSSAAACLNAAYGPENSQGPCENMIAYDKSHGLPNASCHPLPFGVFSGECSGGGCEVCSDATCATPGGGENVCYSFTTDSPTNPICHHDFGGMVVVSNTQMGTGSNWGTQYGSLRNYDSVQGTTPDTITYVGPEDGNMAIEVSANAGLNSTTVTAVSLTNASTGFNAGTITHAQTNPDVWLVTGKVTPLSSYNLGVTFSHTGGYGEYSVRMALGNPSTTKPYTPNLTFGGNSVGLSYSAQNGQYTIDGAGVVHYWGMVTLSAKGTSTGFANLSLPIPPSALTADILGSGFGLNLSTVSGTSNMVPYLNSADRQLYLIEDATSGDYLWNYTDGEFNNNTIVNFSIFYPTR